MSVDGESICSAPCRYKVQPGKHRIEVSKEAHAPLVHEFDVPASTELALDVRLYPSPPRTKAYIAAGASLAFLGGRNSRGQVCRRDVAR